MYLRYLIIYHSIILNTYCIVSRNLDSNQSEESIVLQSWIFYLMSIILTVIVIRLLFAKEYLKNVQSPYLLIKNCV